jgi:hypothetical protein
MCKNVATHRLTALMLLLAVAFLNGCGGSRAGNNNSMTGRAALSITWPSRSRLIPVASNSIRILFTQNGTVLANQLVPRPSAGGTSSVTVNNLKVGALVMAATAYPNADGTGVAQASGTTTINIADNQTTAVTLTMNSTIDHLEATPAPLNGAPGTNFQLVVTAKDVSNAIVLLTPGKITYVPTTNAVTVDSSGLAQAAGPGSGQITVTETESGKQVAVAYNITNPGTPGNVVMYASGDSTMVSYSTDLVRIRTFSTDIYRPSAVAADAAGNVYVAEGQDVHGGAGLNIWKFSSSGTRIGIFAVVAGINTLRFDSAGNLLAMASGGGGSGIVKISPDGSTRTQLVASTTQFRDFTLDAAGNIYASAISNFDNILKFSPTGAPLGVFASVDNSSPSGLAFDAAGNLYVAVYTGVKQGTVQKFNSAGQNVGSIGSGLNGPWGMAFDPAGNLYIAEPGNLGFSKYSPAGVQLARTYGADMPRFVTFGPAPTP